MRCDSVHGDPRSAPSVMTEVVISRPGPPEVLQPRRGPVPEPAAGEVLVRVHAAGVNRPDVMQRMGEYPLPPGVTPIPGLEVAGEIVAVGPGVPTAGHTLGVGERVCGLTNGGGYAEYCVVPVGQLLPIPDGLDPVVAAAIPETYFTVWSNLFQIARARAGDTLLVHGGTSGIGSTALQLAREFGISACSTDGGPEKGRAAVGFGAELSIDYRTEDWVAEVQRWTGGRGVDIVLDIVGGTYLSGNVASLAPEGRLLLIGFLGGAVASELDLLQVALKRAVITGSTMRARTPDEKAAIARDLHARVWPVLAEGRCLPRIHETFPLARAADAHRLMESGRHVGKIVIDLESA